MYRTQNQTVAHDDLAATVLPPLPAPSIADEAHHRIANSLQLLCATVSLEARDVADDASRYALERTRRRIAAIAGVHRQLCQSSMEGRVDLGGYLEELGENLALGCPPGRRVLVRSVAMAVPSQDATAIGMIVSELVANACKYAYPVGAPGDVTIGVQEVPNGYRLTVDDRGRGREGLATGQGLGYRLIVSLASQLQASCTWGSATPGTHFEMLCPSR